MTPNSSNYTISRRRNTGAVQSALVSVHQQHHASRGEDLADRGYIEKSVWTYRDTPFSVRHAKALGIDDFSLVHNGDSGAAGFSVVDFLPYLSAGSNDGFLVYPPACQLLVLPFLRFFVFDLPILSLTGVTLRQNRIFHLAIRTCCR